MIEVQFKFTSKNKKFQLSALEEYFFLDSKVKEVIQK